MIYIATGFDLRETNKEDNTMKKKMPTCEKFFREEGTENTIRNFIERKRSRHVPEEQIREELLLDFGLDAIQARQYMELSLAKV